MQEEGAKSAKSKGGAAALKTNSSSAAGDKPKLDSQEKKEKEKPLKGKQVEVKGDPKGTAKDKVKK